MKKLLIASACAVLLVGPAKAEIPALQVKSTSGIISGTTWTSTLPYMVTMSLDGGSILDQTAADAPGQNVGENLILNTAGTTRTVTLTSSNPYYYISAISMNVRGIKGDLVTFTSRETSVGTDGTSKPFALTFAEGEDVIFTITPGTQNHAKKAICEDFTVTLSAATNPSFPDVDANLTTGTYDNGTGWSRIWTSNTEIVPIVKITASANNMGRSNGIFDFRSGESETSSYTVSTDDSDFYVSGFSFNAKAGADTQNTQIQIGENETVTLTTENQSFSASTAQGESAVFYVKGDNEAVFISDFKIKLSPIHSNTEIAETELPVFNAVNGQLELWESILGEALYNSLHYSFGDPITEDGYSLKVMRQALETSMNAALVEANGRIIYIKNVRRPVANGVYLTSKADDKINTTIHPVANSNWVIERNGTTYNFKLFNPETNKYLGKNAEMSNSGNAAIFKFVKNTSGNPGTALYITNVNDDKGINVDTFTNNLVVYGYNDGGSSWTIELAGVPASEIAAGKYYRIRSARALAKTDWRNQGSLLGVNTAVENNQNKGDVSIDSSKFSGLGTIWKVAEADNGRYYLLNAATEFEGQESMNYFGTGGAYANVTNNKGQFTFLSSASEWQHSHSKAVIIKNQNNQYIDTSTTQNKMGTWEKVDNNWPNNGGIFFFEEATDYDEIKESYIALANSEVISKDNISAIIDENTKIPALWTKSAIANARDAVEKMEDFSFAQTVKEANALHFNTAKDQYNEVSQAIIDALYTEAENRVFVARNMERKTTPDNVPYYLAYVASASCSKNGAANENALGATTDRTSLAAHWTVEYQGNGKFFIKNYLNNRYAGICNSNDMPFSTEEESGTLYEILPYIINNDTIIGFKANNGWFMHQTANDQQDYIVRWNVPTTSHASGWYIAGADDVDNTSSLQINATRSRIDISVIGETLVKHDEYGNHHVITIAKRPVVETRTITEEPTTYALGNDMEVRPYNDNSFTVIFNNSEDEPLDDGVYDIAIPAAAFKTLSGKVTAPASFTLDVNGEDVKVTGIEEVIVNLDNGVEGIYDLQGRRLSAPVKGINIINGKKVLVK